MRIKYKYVYTIFLYGINTHARHDRTSKFIIIHSLREKCYWIFLMLQRRYYFCIIINGTEYNI